MACSCQSTRQVYKVVGTEATTAFNLKLHLQKLLAPDGKNMETEFKGDASGIFTSSATTLENARLMTDDFELLRTKGTLFYFYFNTDAFEVKFYNPEDTTTPLGVLRANPVAPAGEPGSGSGKWSNTF